MKNRYFGTLFHAPLLAAALAIQAASLSAQSREIDVDVLPVTGSLTYAWQYADGRHWGVLAGAGWNEFGVTLSPGQSSQFHDLEQIVFLGGMHRLRTDRFDFDVGVRVGLGDLRSGGDLPNPYYAVYASVLWGGKRIRVGPRLFLANVLDGSGVRDSAIHLDPITLRIILGSAM